MWNIKTSNSPHGTLYTWTDRRELDRFGELEVGIRIEPKAPPANLKGVQASLHFREAPGGKLVHRLAVRMTLQEVRRGGPGWEAQARASLRFEKDEKDTTLDRGAYTIDIVVKLGEAELSTGGSYCEVLGKADPPFDKKRLLEGESVTLPPKTN
jgi:hypothetical protein